MVVEYAAVTEMATLQVACPESSGAPERVYNLAAGKTFAEGLKDAPSQVEPTEPRVVRFIDTIHTLKPEAGRKGFQL